MLKESALDDLLKVISPDLKRIILRLIEDNISLNKELTDLKSRFHREIKADIERRLKEQATKEKNCSHSRTEIIYHQGANMGTHCLICNACWG